MALLYTIITSFDSMLACINNGNYFAVAAFLIMTFIFIAYMTWLIGLAIASGVGIIYMAMFATGMELMYSEMNGSILETC